MTTDASQVVVAGTGAVYRAVRGTPLPTAAAAAIDVAFKDHGYISTDGVAETIDDQTSDITAWQNSDVVRKVQTSQDVMYAFAGLETNAVMLESYYGNRTATAEGSSVEIRGGLPDRSAWVLDFLDGDDKHVRAVIPDGQVTARGGVTRNAQGAFEYPVTITCYPDASGVKAYLYVDDDPSSS